MRVKTEAKAGQSGDTAGVYRVLICRGSHQWEITEGPDEGGGISVRFISSYASAMKVLPDAANSITLEAR